ncbi:MAG: hypothetical protein WCH99_11030 [Verrucomicrobiota bacterium]
MKELHRNRDTMDDKFKPLTETSPGAVAPVRWLKRKAQIYRLLCYLCFFFSASGAGWLLAGGMPFNNFFTSPLILTILGLNLALMALAIYFSLAEKKTPARELWKPGSLVGNWIHGLLLLLLAVIVLVIILAFVAMATGRPFHIGPFDIGL